MAKNKYFILLFLISLLPFINTISNGYSLDDDFVTEINNTTKGFSSLKEIFTTHYIENKGGFSYEYRPIVKLSFAIEHQFFGIKPALSHFINVLLYGIFCIFLYRFLILLIDIKHKNIIFLSVLIFALLPIHTEVVASLKNRDILLSGIFGLIAGIQVFKENITFKNYILAVLSVFLSFGSKQDALALMLIVIFVLFITRNKIPVTQKSLLTFSLVLGYMILWLMKKNLITTCAIRPISYYENPLVYSNSISELISTVFFTFGFYTKQIFFPYKMSCYYGFDFTDFSSLKNMITIFGIIVFLGLTVLFYQKRFTDRIILIALVFIGVFFIMYSNIFVKVPGIVADRYAFFPSIGFSMLLASTLLKNTKSEVFQLHQLKSFKYPLLMILIIFMIVSINRNSDWRDRLSLFSNDSEKFPKSYKLLTMLATEQIQRANNSSLQLSQQQRQVLAMNAFKNFEKANLIYDKDYETLNNLGYFEMNFNRNYSAALNYFQSSLKEKSTFPDVYFNIGIAFKNLNQTDSSLKYFNTCITKFPQYHNAYQYLADTYFNLGLIENLNELIKLEISNQIPEQIIQNHKALLLKMEVIREQN